MGGDWEEVQISELCELIVDCVNKTAPKIDSITSYKMLRTTNVRHGRVDVTACKYVNKETFEKWTRRSTVLKGDILLTREAPIGEVGRVNVDENLFLGQRLMQYRVNPNLLDSRFLLYSFLTPYLQYQFQMHEGTGSVVSHIRVPDCFVFKIPTPPLPEQKAIAHILGSLDDKIELNRQMNQTLESMAQALFKSWFVDFDPVIDNALAAGHTIPECFAKRAEQRQKQQTERAANKTTESTDFKPLFPNAFEYTEEMGWIPKGWGVGNISSVSTLNAKSWTKKNYPSEVSYVDLSNTKNGRLNAVIPYCASQAPSRARRVLNIDDTIIGTVRPGNKSFAYIHEENLTGSTGFAVMTPIEKSYRSFLYLNLTQDEVIDQFAHLADGGAYPAIRPSVVSNLEIVIPTRDIFMSFDSIVHPMIDKTGKHEQQSSILKKLRDTLLPKLLSGEIRIPDAEKLIAEVE